MRGLRNERDYLYFARLSRSSHLYMPCRYLYDRGISWDYHRASEVGQLMNHKHEPYGHCVWGSSLDKIEYQFMNCKCGELLARNTTPAECAHNWTDWSPHFERGNK